MLRKQRHHTRDPPLTGLTRPSHHRDGSLAHRDHDNNKITGVTGYTFSERATQHTHPNTFLLTTMWQTSIREAITPYLPPPVVHVLRHQIDPQLEAYGAGPEGTVSILTTLLVAWTILVTIRLWVTRVRTGRAVIEDDDAILQSATTTTTTTTQNYKHTVLLMGPTNGGKTRLFYRLTLGPEYSHVPTVASIQANVGYYAGDIRYVDWPGYASLEDKLLERIVAETDRVILVLDASQPVGSAADILYFLCAQKKPPPPRKVFVACHKTDLGKAKNWRRIKIQLRTELERLLSARPDKWWPAGKALDLDDLPAVQLYFGSTSCESRLSPELLDFCEKGILPESNN